jgi:hypothetical protein
MGDGPQVPLRQTQVLGGRFQITVPEQNLDGAQVGACFQPVGRPTGVGNMYSLGFAPLAPRFRTVEYCRALFDRRKAKC